MEDSKINMKTFKEQEEWKKFYAHKKNEYKNMHNV